MIKAVVADSPYNETKMSTCDIKIEGLSHMSEDGGSVVWIEFYNGKWWVRVWADINEEDPTHSIDLSGAMDTARKFKGYNVD